MVAGYKTGGRQKGTPNKTPAERAAAAEQKERRALARAERSPLSELAALARTADKVEQKVAKARAARRRAADEYKAAAKVLAPTLAALKAAVAALEALIGPAGDGPGARNKSPREAAANGTSASVPLPDGPPLIREIRTIIVDDGVNRAEAKRIQEREIEARAEWRPSVSAN